jgi:hypothetical protein
MDSASVRLKREGARLFGNADEEVGLLNPAVF